MEGVEIAAQGHLKIPDGVVIGWPDDGHCEILDHNKLSAGEGMYYHTAMHDRIASQLTEMVEPQRIVSEFRRAAEAEATEYLLINVSDVRPVVFTTAVAMQFAWNPNRDLDEVLKEWAHAKVGEERSAELLELWHRYFDSPWHYGEGYPDRLEDNAYQTFSRGLLIAAGKQKLDDEYVYTTFDVHFPRPYKLLGPRTGRSLAHLFTEGTSQVQSTLDSLLIDAMNFRETVDAEVRSFINDHLVTQ